MSGIFVLNLGTYEFKSTEIEIICHYHQFDRLYYSNHPCYICGIKVQPLARIMANRYRRSCRNDNYILFF